MIKKMINVFLMLVFSLSLIHCVVARPRQAPPPPPRKLVKIRKPGSNYTWIPGHYKWRKGRYYWVKGYWKKGRRGHVWVKGHWVKRGGHWVYIEGHWRKR